MTSIQNQLDTILASAYVAGGSDPPKIDSLARMLGERDGITLISVDPNGHYDHTNLIYGGSSSDVLDATLSLADNVRENIRLEDYQENKYLYGVLDQLSFLPLHSDHLPTCAALARRLGKTLSERMEIPVYLFSDASEKDNAPTMQHFRQLSHQDFPASFDNPQWQPDYPVKNYHPSLGSCMIGARLYHINVAIYFGNCDMEGLQDLTKLENYAADLDEYMQGISEKIVAVVEDLPGNKGARIICNIPNYVEAPLGDVLNLFRQISQQQGIHLYGCEILGYLPIEALVKSGQSTSSTVFFDAVEEDLKYITLAIQTLQLNSIVPFDLNRQILDYHFEIDLDHT